MRVVAALALLFLTAISHPVSGQKEAADLGRTECVIRYHRPTKIVQPSYPEVARLAHINGTVVLDCVIARDGTVKSIHARKGPAVLIRAATDAVWQWRYKPLLLNGKAAEFETTISVVFTLPKEPSKRAGAKSSF